MTAAASHIMEQLKRAILPLETAVGKPSMGADLGLGAIAAAFPGNQFPTGVIHEFIYSNPSHGAATGGFVSGILGKLMRKQGASIWINAAADIFPPALANYGIAPENIIFITVKKEKDILWTMEEALKCEGITAVVGELQELSFTASRRLQLAVEKSKSTGFVLRCNPKAENITSCVSRWKITPLPGITNGLPGVGFPAWKVHLLKVRNGRPGSWDMTYAAGRFSRLVSDLPVVRPVQSKTG
ncbi:MAG: Error-prone repair protein ImuA [Chitinophagaceae bacterium]|nr:MAG: Error-prone repair protein ImuA [Chitinophagaceae bacterium]